MRDWKESNCGEWKQEVAKKAGQALFRKVSCGAAAGTRVAPRQTICEHHVKKSCQLQL
jgi:hypothetical protein